MQFTRIATLLLTLSSLTATGYSAEEYRLGAGDVVKISVYNNPAMDTEAEIAGDGTISFPLIGRTPIGGLSRADAERLIARRLVEGRFLLDAQVNLAVVEYRSQQVSVLGEVANPGRYAIGPVTTLSELLAQAGGVTDEGSQVVSLVRHDRADGRKAEQRIDLRQALRGGREADTRLVDGDVVFVPRAANFYIYGEVRKPGAYPLQETMTVRQALSVGGGLTPRGTERGLRITRRGADGREQTMKVELDEQVQPGDVIRVKESLF